LRIFNCKDYNKKGQKQQNKSSKFDKNVSQYQKVVNKLMKLNKLLDSPIKSNKTWNLFCKMIRIKSVLSDSINKI